MVVDTDNGTSRIEPSERTPDAERRVGERERLSRVVVAAMADALDRPVREIAPLHDTVDLDALDDLFGPQYDGTPRTGGRVEFVHGACRVVVENGDVRVYCD